jgi:hypothetical protein
MSLIFNMEFSAIYKIQSKIKPERIYIGSSGNITDRWYNHMTELKGNRHSNNKLQNHIPKKQKLK